MTESRSPVLAIDDLSVSFAQDRLVHRAVRGISFRIEGGQTLALIGESGSGKTASVMAISRLLPRTAQVGGRIQLLGRDLQTLSDSQFRGIRGRDIGVVFQDPGSALNPAVAVGEQISSVLRLRGGLSRRDARARAIELMSQVGISSPGLRFGAYPFEFSGGMRQRILIASAISLNPSVLIADEPTTALDVTVQMEVLRLLRELQHENGMAMIFVTHDIDVARLMADTIAVMYAGRIIEIGAASEVCGRPTHPYTKALLAARPSRSNGTRLTAIRGLPPASSVTGPGCSFAPRCDVAMERCSHERHGLARLHASAVDCWVAHGGSKS